MNIILPQFVDFNQKTAFYKSTFLPMSFGEFFLLSLSIVIISFIISRVCFHYWDKKDRVSAFLGRHVMSY